MLRDGAAHLTFIKVRRTIVDITCIDSGLLRHKHLLHNLLINVHEPCEYYVSDRYHVILFERKVIIPASAHGRSVVEGVLRFSES